MIDLSKYRALSDDICSVDQSGPREVTVILRDDADIKTIIKKVHGLSIDLTDDQKSISIVYAYDNGRTIELT